MDQEYEAFLVKNILSLKHFPLVGVNASDTGLYLGPAFIYFAAIPFAIFGGNPVGWGISASIIGVFVTYLVYRVGKEIFSNTIGLVAAFLYGGSFLTSFYDRQFWNPTLVPFFSLILGLLLYRLLMGEIHNLVWFMLVFGLAIQSHLSLFIFLPTVVCVFWLKRKKIPRKILFWSCVLFLLTQLPLLIFELRHDFLNTKAAIKLITNQRINASPLSTLPIRNTAFISTLGRFIWVPAPVDFFAESGQCKELVPFMKNQTMLGSLLIIFIAICLILWRFEKHKDKKNAKALSLVIIITLPLVLFVIFYNRYILPYYFAFYFPWFSLLLGWYISIPLIFFFFILNIFTLITAKYDYSYKEKMDALRFVADKIGKHAYLLEALGECPRFGGQRYLAEYTVGTPVHSYMDSYFAWLYPETIKEDRSADIVLLSMIDHRMGEDLIAKWEKIKIRYLTEYNLVESGRFGKIHVLILSPK